MALERLARLLVVLFAIWIALGIVALILFHFGGTHPGDGKGDPIGLSWTP